MSESAARRGRRIPPFLLPAILGSAAIAAMLALSMANAVGVARLAGEGYRSYRENVIDQSASLARVIFAAHRVVAFAPKPGEPPALLLERRMSASVGLLSHAQFVARKDRDFLAQMLGDDPLMLGERSAASDRDYEAALASLRLIADRAAKAEDAAVRERLLDYFKAETGKFMELLEARSMVLVQLEDQLFTVSKERITQLLGHSGSLVLSVAALFVALGAATVLYLRSLLRTQAELALHRNHLSELVDRRTAELSAEIEERRRVEELLRATVSERETLLKEVYHRVKNNLTMVNSLIGLQRSESPPEAGAVFEDLESRVAAISLIHEKLYKSTDLRGIGLEEYLGDLARSLVRSLCEDPESIRVESEAPGIRLPADVLIPLGLMATEIVTNAIKHGFKGRAGGLLTIQAEAGERGLVLVIADDGAPAACASAILESHSLGALLVQDLCKQLKGSLELVLAGGTSYRFTFPALVA